MTIVDLLAAMVIGLPCLAALSTLFVRNRWIIPLRIIQLSFLLIALVLFGNFFIEEVTPDFLKDQLFISMFAFAFMGSPLIAAAVRQREGDAPQYPVVSTPFCFGLCLLSHGVGHDTQGNR